MLTYCGYVVKHMTFDAETPIDTVFNDIEELGYIATVALNTYNKHKNTNFYYNFINRK